MDAYLNVDEVEAAIARLATEYSGLCALIELPHKTANRRVCHALRVSTSPQARRPTVFVLGGMHGAEWGTSDAVVALAADLLRAYSADAGLKYCGKIFSKEAIRAFMTSRDLILFPQVNPDGRAYSQQHDALEVPGWRKNRREIKVGATTVEFGVDLNRNFDVAWDFRRVFKRDAAYVSDQPVFDDYQGPAAFSEAESCNVRWLLDQHTEIAWLADVHGPAGVILCNWGIDQTQTQHPDQNILNRAWDGKRGEGDDCYGEYKPAREAQLAASLAQRMSDAVFEVRKTRWPPGPLFDTLYPVSGALADYASARHRMDPKLPSIQSFIIEHGGTFHPAWATMAPIVAEVCVALLELCVAVA